jgi:oligoendopeptidase F
MGTTQAPPHWQMASIYPGLDSEEFKNAFSTWSQMIDELTKFFDEHNIQAAETEGAQQREVEEAVSKLETVIQKLNEARSLGHKLYAYITGFTTTDSRDIRAQTWSSRFLMQMARLERLDPRFAAWIGDLDLEHIQERSEVAQDHTYALQREQIHAQHLMSPEEEALATELNLTGGRAWARLYNNFTSQINADIEMDGQSRTLPITAIRNLAHEKDRDLRRRAYEVELKAWEANALPIAAALNSIKGQANTLNERRGWSDPLDVALFNNHIDRETLGAMLDTARSFFPQFRRYLLAKARALNVESLAWYDLFAPVGAFERTWSFERARSFIIEQFASFSRDLADLATRAFGERWIDAEPRDGKRGGAFCMWIQEDESRILSNFQPAYGGVSTLAHELGHAYHNFNLANQTYIQRQTPMTLAETASTFNQIIVREAALERSSPIEQLAILEADLQDTTQVVVDITSRFLFEQEVFNRRRAQTLAVEEFCDIMIRCQKQTYGAGLTEDKLHPYMWAVKPHYYGSTFYNFPYMFGLLFGLGLYAHYRESPNTFVTQYKDLLASTGMEEARTLASRFGINIRSQDFWKESLQIVTADIERFEALVDQMVTERHF